MAINFSTIHSALKNSIDNNGFTYSGSGAWFNFNYEIYPTSSHDGYYTIKPAKGKHSPDYQADDWHDTYWMVEFCLDGTNDAYISNMNTIHNEILTLESISGTNIVEIEYTRFRTRHYNTHIVLTYEIKITLNE